jgi:hypothetical protein
MRWTGQGAFGTFPRVPPPRDPRLRPYRVALWVIYFGAIVLGVGLMVASVARNLRGPSRPDARSGALPTRAALRVCLSDLEVLYREQNQRAWTLAREIGEEGALASFDAWSRDWERRVHDLGDRCHLDGSGEAMKQERAELARARDALVSLHRAYRAQVNRFAQEQGELVEEAVAALRNARAAVTHER